MDGRHSTQWTNTCVFQCKKKKIQQKRETEHLSILLLWYIAIQRGGVLTLSQFHWSCVCGSGSAAAVDISAKKKPIMSLFQVKLNCCVLQTIGWHHRSRDMLYFSSVVSYIWVTFVHWMGFFSVHEREAMKEDAKCETEFTLFIFG